MTGDEEPTPPPLRLIRGGRRDGDPVTRAVRHDERPDDLEGVFEEYHRWIETRLGDPVPLTTVERTQMIARVNVLAAAYEQSDYGLSRSDRHDYLRRIQQHA
jgi:hypothetical protein